MKEKRKSINELVGEKFNRLTVLGRAPNDHRGQTYLYVRCDCGVEKTVRANRVRNGYTKSCGCYLIDVATTHNMAYTAENDIWRGMKKRCYNKNTKSYHRYGGRGIKVCDEWLNSFETFYKDMGKRPSDKHTIERIDNDADYCKENCKWATMYEQNINRSTNHILLHKGEMRSLKEISVMEGLAYGTFVSRLKRGWTLYDAINKPIRKRLDD